MQRERGPVSVDLAVRGWVRAQASIERGGYAEGNDVTHWPQGADDVP
jgi:hypothetical protein